MEKAQIEGESRPPLALKLKAALTAVAAVAVAAWFLAPLLLIAVSAFAETEELYRIDRLLPTRFTLRHFDDLFFKLEAWRAIVASVKAAALAILISFALGLPAAYALSRYVFAGKSFLRLLILATRMFPMMVLVIPLVTVFLRIGLSDTAFGIALAHSTMVLPMIILISASILSGVSVEYEEAAMVFGLSRPLAFFRITLPLALPGLAASAILAFIMSWNEVFVAAILTPTNRTLPAHILKTAMASPDSLKFAAGFIMAVPALVFIYFVRKRLITMWGISLK